MGWSREELAERARTTARMLLDRLEGERLVIRFVDSYVIGFDRPGIKTPADQYQERLASLRGEAVLWMATTAVQSLRRRLARLRLGPLVWRNADAEAWFAKKFWEALAQHLVLGPGTVAELERQWSGYAVLPDHTARAERFAARVAPLLDPLENMRAKAHFAGTKFVPVLTSAAEKAVEETLG